MLSAQGGNSWSCPVRGQELDLIIFVVPSNSGYSTVL